MRRLVLFAAVATLVVAGCAREPQPAPPSPPPREVPRPAPAPAPSAAEYVSGAGSFDLFVIRSSELALARSQDPRLREVARQMIRAHTGTSGQLSFAGRRLNLLPSVTMRPEHQAMMRQLAQSPDFDRLYWRQQVSLHDQAIDLHRGYSTSGRSATLRPVAAAAVPIEQSHLAQLRAMR